MVICQAPGSFLLMAKVSSTVPGPPCEKQMQEGSATLGLGSKAGCATAAVHPLLLLPVKLGGWSCGAKGMGNHNKGGQDYRRLHAHLVHSASLARRLFALSAHT